MMNSIERKMVSLLRDLRDTFGVELVKGEFESEGTRKDEFLRLKDVASSAGIGLIIKIGGGEAIRDMRDAQLIGANGIVAPMIETPYALQKYVQAAQHVFNDDAREDVRFGINVETKFATTHAAQILASPFADSLDWITAGRVDLCGSLGRNRDDINCDEVFGIVRELFASAKSAGFETTLGGGIAVESLSFIQRLIEESLIDRFETRKVVFPAPEKLTREGMDARVLLANEFELLWLRNKANYYGAIAQEDASRIQMLERRVESAKQSQATKAVA